MTVPGEGVRRISPIGSEPVTLALKVRPRGRNPSLAWGTAAG